MSTGTAVSAAAAGEAVASHGLSTSRANADWEEERAAVLRWARGHTGHHHDAEDLAQDVMVKALMRGGDVQEAAYRSWLYRVTRNQFLDGARRRQRLRFDALPENVDSLMQDLTTPESEYFDSRFDERTSRALADLSPEQRTTLLLKDVHDLSYEEISEHTQVPPGTVRSRIHRSRRKLAQELAA